MNRYIELVAARHGVSPEEVRAEIQKAIDLTWPQDQKPTPEELILFLALQV